MPINILHTGQPSLQGSVQPPDVVVPRLTHPVLTSSVCIPLLFSFNHFLSDNKTKVYFSNHSSSSLIPEFAGKMLTQDLGFEVIQLCCFSASTQEDHIVYL